ncbi:hypothetical protein QWY28_17185 [Nocardioides sp. SOB77]|uniref:Uncharacterized protein n=1 Tax=Nocardioides oceani TaxID=3058369 RepID=A0ABT8FJK0_9ACTN|nr:hypothetical protein [Nocardioides oceani]MDN4174699.1 hypothetical protein [Nocardioides oceani]
MNVGQLRAQLAEHPDYRPVRFAFTPRVQVDLSTAADDGLSRFVDVPIVLAGGDDVYDALDVGHVELGGPLGVPTVDLHADDDQDDLVPQIDIFWWDAQRDDYISDLVSAAVAPAPLGQDLLDYLRGTADQLRPAHPGIANLLTDLAAAVRNTQHRLALAAGPTDTDSEDDE